MSAFVWVRRLSICIICTVIQPAQGTLTTQRACQICWHKQKSVNSQSIGRCSCPPPPSPNTQEDNATINRSHEAGSDHVQGLLAKSYNVGTICVVYTTSWQITRQEVGPSTAIYLGEWTAGRKMMELTVWLYNSSQDYKSSLSAVQTSRPGSNSRRVQSTFHCNPIHCGTSHAPKPPDIHILPPLTT